MQERAIRNFYDARNQYIKERPHNIHILRKAEGNVSIDQSYLKRVCFGLNTHIMTSN